MLSVYSGRDFNRRTFLRIGSLGLGSLALPQLLDLSSTEAASSALRDKSVIFLFLHGGPSQTETFDPKMTAPGGVRSATGQVPTSLPGISFGGTFPKLASLANRMAIVRSFHTGDGIHDIKPIVSPYSVDANLGSLYARVAGTNHPRTGMPRNVALFPRAVNDMSQPANVAFGRFDSTGSLGAAYAPFVPGRGHLQEDMKLHLPVSRLEDRRELLSNLDQFKRSLAKPGTSEGLGKFRLQAYETILGGVADAFDLSREDPRVVARYDTSALVRPDQISRRWNNYHNYVDNAQTLGKLLLLARRLCEAGCGFVTVTTNFVWDMHADINNATMHEGMQYMGVPLDHALSAYIQDVESRGLQDKILLVACGEMGRTPKINFNGGRDHWGRIAPLLMHGGGLQMGQVIGESSPDAGEPATKPYSIENLNATVLRTLVDVGQLRLQSGIPGDVARVYTGGQPIDGLM